MTIFSNRDSKMMQDFLWKGGSTIKILRIFYSECQYFSSVNVTSVKICTPTSTFWRHQCDPPLHFNSSIQIYSIASKIRLKKWLEKGGLALSRNRKVMSPIDIKQLDSCCDSEGVKPMVFVSSLNSHAVETNLPINREKWHFLPAVQNPPDITIRLGWRCECAIFLHSGLSSETRQKCNRRAGIRFSSCWMVPLWVVESQELLLTSLLAA